MVFAGGLLPPVLGFGSLPGFGLQGWFVRPGNVPKEAGEAKNMTEKTTEGIASEGIGQGVATVSF